MILTRGALGQQLNGCERGQLKINCVCKSSSGTSKEGTSAPDTRD